MTLILMYSVTDSRILLGGLIELYDWLWL